MGIYEEVTATFLSGKCKWNLFYRSFSFIVAPGPHALIVAFVSILLVTMTVRLTMSPSVLSSALHCQCSLNQRVQSSSCHHVAKMKILSCCSLCQSAQSNNSSVVKDDKLDRAVLMKNCSQASFCGGDNHQEARLSQKMMFKVPGKTAMSDVVVSKMDSTALIKKGNSAYLIVPIVKHVVDNFNQNNIVPICDCVFFVRLLCSLHFAQ